MFYFSRSAVNAEASGDTARERLTELESYWAKLPGRRKITQKTLLLIIGPLFMIGAVTLLAVEYSVDNFPKPVALTWSLINMAIGIAYIGELRYGADARHRRKPVILVRNQRDFTAKTVAAVVGAVIAFGALIVAILKLLQG
jgi:hypothetical protein